MKLVYYMSALVVKNSSNFDVVALYSKTEQPEASNIPTEPVIATQIYLTTQSRPDVCFSSKVLTQLLEQPSTCAVKCLKATSPLSPSVYEVGNL